MPKAKILVVDDRESVRQAICLPLEYEGFETCEASSGKEAIEKIEEDPDIRLIFLDIIMEGMNGIETLKQIKQIAPYMEVCMLSAEDTDKNMDMAFYYGACGFLSKPCDAREIIYKAQAIREK